MTTIKQILDAKAQGDDSGVKYQIKQALTTGEALDYAEDSVRQLSKAFRKASDLITKLTGLELWHSDDDGVDVFYWKKPAPTPGYWNASVEYLTRAAAIQALLDDKIEWK